MMTAEDMDEERALEFVARGNSLAESGSHELALVWFRKAVDAGADWALINVGNALSDLGRVPESVEAYEKAIQCGDDDAWLNLGMSLERLGEVSAAVVAYVQAVRCGDPQALCSLAVLYRELDDRSSAERILLEASRVEASKELAAAVETTWRWEDTHRGDLEYQLETAAKVYPYAAQCLEELRKSVIG